MTERHRQGLLLRCAAMAATALLLASCNSATEPDDAEAPLPTPAATAEPSSPAPAWDLASSGEGVALVLTAGDRAGVRLFCPAGSETILVNVPAFRPIGSEERLSFGSDGEVEALVADTRGDRERGGVSGTGAVPGNLSALIAGPVSVVYGAQTSGPHPAPPPLLASAFVEACREPARAPDASASPARENASACLIQDGKRLSVAPLRAVGTEPFWGARIEGRCVTYSHIEDQQGTRVWTRYAAAPGGGGVWTGALGGRPFILATRPQPGCSDGMSDRRYPIAVELTVGGEDRRGCAHAG